MSTFIALIRGINVGGKNLVEMPHLIQVLSLIGLVKPRFLLQSGNLIFEADDHLTSLELEEMLESGVETHLERSLQFIVRKAEEWKEMIVKNPFPDEAKAAPNHLLVMFLLSAPPESGLVSLKAIIRGKEYFKASNRELYLVYPDGIGRSKFTGAVIERKLRALGTARNWNTIEKIAAVI